jgi:hypothetical protein
MAATFEKSLAFSRSKQANRAAREALEWRFPDLQDVQPAILQYDRKGVDFWVTLEDGRYVGIDLKVQNFHNGTLPLEIWSNVARHRVGWTLRPDYITDYVLWVWPRYGLAKMMEFRPLQVALRTHKIEWCRRYKVRQQYTPTADGSFRKPYYSEIVPVPIDIVQRAVSDLCYASAA